VSAPPPLVLASGSPRRRELLARLGVEFEIRPSDTDEQPLPGEAPDALARRLALAKARAAARPGEVALGADTDVALDGEIFGKPRDEAEARRMLRRLAGRTHQVWSGVALVEIGPDGLPRREAVEVVRSDVRFRDLTDDEIAAYAATGEPLDRAGAYAIQGGAAPFVAELAGDLSNVVGLPLAATRALLARFGFAPPALDGDGASFSRRP
jgi:septum formation protein